MTLEMEAMISCRTKLCCYSTCLNITFRFLMEHEKYLRAATMQLSWTDVHIHISNPCAFDRTAAIARGDCPMRTQPKKKHSALFA